MSQPPMPPVPPGTPGPPHPTSPPGFGPPYTGGWQGAQPPYGSTPPNFPRPPAPPGRPGGGRKRRTAVIAGCVTAAVAVLAAGAFAFLQPDDDQRQKSKADGKRSSPTKTAPSTQGRQLLTVPPPKEDVEGDSHRADGTWVTSRSYVSGGLFSVLGYDLDSGKQTWAVPLDGDLCGASQEVTSKGYVAVAFAGSKKDRSKCTEFAVIDINQGRKVWQKTLPEATLGLDLSVAVTEDFAAVGWSEDSSWGFTVDTGRTVWDSPPQGCGYEEFLGGTTLTSMALCGGDRLTVTQREPGTGEPSRTIKLPAGLGYAYLASAEPLVVASHVGDGKDSLDANRLFTFNPDGSIKSTIKIDGYVPGCGSTGCHAVAASKDTVYLASRREHLTSGNHIAAFDAGTGRRTWTVDGVGSAEMLPLRAEEDGVVAYSNAGTGKRGSGVLHLAAADGEQTVLLKQPDTFEASNATAQMSGPGMKERILYEDGRLFFHRVSGFFIGDVPMTLGFTGH
ncbi:PQQ-binding-like beta-propeller repeat protein [Streptomyces sp. cmx-18-6]|uniref:outer membrane protein assembly factor BamB family protein n=1 Tax=Streptomyces sp. cmx-18-6 TaxID=2790930 RepID=UPI00398161F1